MRAAAKMLGAAAIAVACSRTPPEPAPATTTSTPAEATVRPASAPAAAPAAPSRCLAETPAPAPAIPKPAPAAACPRDPEPAAAMPTAQVSFPDAPGSPHVEVELAKTPHEVEKGLMYRRAMPEDHGMLFRLEDRREHTFWMHNTCIALDMLFVDDDGVVVGIVEGAEPLTDASRSVGCPSRFVLELNAGWCRRHGVRAGQRLGLPLAIR